MAAKRAAFYKKGSGRYENQKQKRQLYHGSGDRASDDCPRNDNSGFDYSVFLQPDDGTEQLAYHPAERGGNHDGEDGLSSCRGFSG